MTSVGIRELKTRLDALHGNERAARNIVEGRLAETAAARLRGLMTRVMSRWSVVAVTSEVLASGRSRFPKEPVRALDAIHLGTLLVTRTSVPDLQVLSLDDRVRDNARLLGFTVLPS